MSVSTEDLRSFLTEIEARSKLLRITKAVDVQQQIPALCSETTLPILFENLTGHAGFRLVDCLLRDRLHQSLALKCDEKEVREALFERLKARGEGKVHLKDFM